jgi:F-type H+-transporting ATPase subunit epsilon
MSTFNLEIHTPYKRFFVGKAEHLILTVQDGQIGILPGHNPFSAPIEVCIMRVLYAQRADEKPVWRSAFLSDGVIEMLGSKVTIVADTAEWPEDIDFERVEQSKNAALAELKEETFTFAATAAKKKLKRAEVRLSLRDVKTA